VFKVYTAYYIVVCTEVYNIIISSGSICFAIISMVSFIFNGSLSLVLKVIFMFVVVYKFYM
jgi:hypothetical protein